MTGKIKFSDRRLLPTAIFLALFLLSPLAVKLGHFSRFFRYFFPGGDTALAADTSVFITSTASTTWVLPSDWNNSSNTIEVIGGGGGGGAGSAGGGGGGKTGGGGGASGAYAKISNLSLGTATSVGIGIGVGGATSTAGGDSWFNATSSANCTSSSVCAKAKGGGGGTAGVSNTAGSGGTATAGSIGTATSTGANGGAGGGLGSSTGGSGGGGGAGAGGPNGAGNIGTGGVAPTSSIGSVGAKGGQGDGTSGGAGGGGNGTNGGNGTEWSTSPAYGAGGGASGGTGGNSGSAGSAAGTAGTYGSGGGGGGGGGSSQGAAGPGSAGAQGIIVITYTPAAPGTPGTPTYTAVGTSTLTVNWTSATNATYYKIERATSTQVYVQISTTTALSYGDSALATTTTFYYRVRGTNGGGDGPYSASSSVTTADLFPPTPNPMTWASVPAANGTSSLTMTATTGTDATPPVQYLFINTPCTSNGGTGGASSTWQASTTYTNTGLQVNQCYAYKIQAEDSVSSTNAGTASASSSAYTFANAPLAPTLSSPTTSTLSITNNANGNPSANPTTLFSVQVTSTSPSDAGWNGFFVDSTGASSAVAVWMSNATLNAVAVKNLKSNTAYTFAAQAENQTPTVTAWSPTGAGTTLPEQPGTPTYTSVASSTLTANWTSSLGATYYKIERATSTQVYVQISTTTAKNYPDSGLSANNTYFYRIRGTNSSGDGPYSASSSQLTLPDAPGTPTYTNVSTSTLTVNWTAPGGGTTYYKIERATSTQVYVQISTTTALSYGDSGLSMGTTFYYRLRATNASGDGSYSASSSVSTTSNSPPATPSQDSPLNAAQDQPTATVFKLTATDPNSDKLQYKVTVYSNSGCTTVAQTDDQSSSQTGWSGQNAICVSGSDCYNSGTQGTYTTQSSLSSSTTYYWIATAIDPLGSNTWSASSSCESFATTYGNWTTDSGSWSIVANQLAVKPSSGSSVGIHASGQSQTNGVIEFKLKSSSVGANTGRAGGFVRDDGAGSRYNLTSGDFQNNQELTGKTISGAYSTITSSTFSFSAATFYEFRGYISGTSLQSWINGGTALSTTDSALGSAGFLGLFASSTSGAATSTFDDFAFYSSPTVTMNNLPSGGSWAVRNSGGANVGGTCATASTIDLSTATTSIPIDYDAGGGSVAVWTGNSSCAGSPDLTYPASGLSTGIFGGDVYSYNAAVAATGMGAQQIASATITIGSNGLITY